MSLVASYCKCSDGKWYEEPTWRGEGWFVCLDDDDPIELVLKVGISMPSLPWLRVTRRNGVAGRLFGENLEFQDARSYWCIFTEVPPVPQEFDEVFDVRPKRQGVFFDYEAQGKHDPTA